MMPSLMPRSSVLLHRLGVVLACWLVACGPSETTLEISGSEDTDESRPDTQREDDDAERDSEESLDTDAAASADTDATDTADDPDALVGIAIVPAELVIQTGLGVPATANLQLVATFGDGREEPIGASLSWTSDNTEIFSVSRTGQITTAGTVPGTTFARVSYEGFNAQALIRVQLTSERVLDGLTPADVLAMDGPFSGSEAGAPVWQYPEDGTMFPAGMLSPVMQWAANGNTLFHLRGTRSDDVIFDIYTTSTAFPFSPEEWEALGAGYGEPIVLELSGRPSATTGEVSVAPARIVYTADASLAGNVYYWQVETGDIMLIPQGATTPTPVFTTNANTGTCRGCHTLSRDGGRLGFMYNGGDNPRAGIANTSAPEPAVIENNTENRWTLMGFDPSGTRAAAVYNGGMWLADVTPGLPGGVANLGPIATAGMGTMPAWSPDGSTVAIARRFDGADWSFNSSELCLMNWDSATGTFGEPRVILSGDGPDGDAYSYPSWSPDSRWLAYARAPNTGNADPQTLWLYHLSDGTSTRLTRANPNAVDVQPAFSPFIEGGYYWILFYSRRPYGHIATDRKQLWVAAIRTDMEPGIDGSFPAFWLPGQDPTRQNITGYWAPPICTNEGDVCKTEEECCSGQECVYSEASGTTVCQNSTCTRDSFACTTTEECCDGSTCRPSLTGTLVCQRDID